MGQHKHNPTAVAKATGEKLPEKPKKVGRREYDRMTMRVAQAMIQDRLGLPLLEDRY